MSKPTGKPNGRPKKQINYELVEDLASIFCTQEEIASIMKCDVRTLQRDEEFCRLYIKNIDNAKSSLRRVQYKKAMSGNTTMLIWLGKQYLGQSDKMVVDNQADAIKSADEIITKVRTLAKGAGADE